MKDIMDIFSTIEQSEGRGALLFILITIYFTMVQIIFHKHWIVGFKGENGRWEGPEITIYLFNLVWPIIIFADQLLKLPASEWVWLFLLLLLAFALMGRAGFEAILNWRSKLFGSKEDKAEDKTQTPKI